MKYLFKLMSILAMGLVLFSSMAQADTRILAFGNNLDFGSVNVGENVSKELILYNRGDSPLTINEIRFHETISDVYSGSYAGVIPAGGQQSVTITFSPTSESDFVGLVYVESDRTNTNDRSQLLSGEGIIDSSVERTRILAFGENLDFGDVLIGESVTKELTLYNRGNSPLTIDLVRFHSRLKGRFDGEFSGVIPAGGEQKVSITFTPNETELYQGLVYIESDRTNTNDRSQLLSGKGVDLSSVEPTRILTFGGNLDFGNVPLLESVTKELVLYNEGNSPLTIEEIRFHSRLKGRFIGGFSGVIPAGGEQRVAITFTPNEEELYQGLVYVESDRTNTQDRSRLLTGMGIPSSGSDDINLDDGLVIHYDFEDNINDSSGNDFNGVEQGTMSYVDSPFGKAGHFDNNFLTVSNLDGLPFSDELSVTSFIKPIAFANESGDALFNLSGLGQLELNRYSSIVWTFKDDTLKIYVDGVFLASHTMTLNTLKESLIYSVTVLSTSPRSLGFFKGDIDDFRLYDRALNEAEIQELYSIPTV